MGTIRHATLTSALNGEKVGAAEWDAAHTFDLAISDVTGLQAALDAISTPDIADIFGLTAALDAKADDADLSGYVTSSALTTALAAKQDALGFMPYNATNPAGYITSAALSGYATTAAVAAGYQPLGTYYTPGGTDVAIADGGTGASTAAGARTNLGLAIGADVKANAPSVQSVTSSATVTPTFSDDAVKITAQAAGLTLANPSGTAIPMWGWAIRIKDNGTARSIAYGTQYRAIGVTLPTTTVINKTLYLGCIWNADDMKVDVVAVAQEA